MGSKRPLGEKASRERMIGHARANGCEAELLKIFAEFDELIKHVKSEEELKAVRIMGLIKIDNFFGGKGDFLPVGLENNLSKLSGK